VLGEDGFRELTASRADSTGRIVDAVHAIDGLTVVGRPTGPMVAVAVDASLPAERRVDPHLWADEMRVHGFVVQLQPASLQPDGSMLPSTAHLTITPVTEQVAEELVVAAAAAADAVRGLPHHDGPPRAQGVRGAVARTSRSGSSARPVSSAATIWGPWPRCSRSSRPCPRRSWSAC
jgi:hypothetical protein